MEYFNENPSVHWDKKVPDTNLEKFQKIVQRKYNLKFETYWDFHKWSVENYEKFLEELWNFFGIISSKPYKKVWVKTGPGFLDNEWFSGAELNFAENMLRIRDETVALICLDEFGNEDIINYAELFEEVKLYAAAFRKNGLKIGDSVACYMSNRKEAIIAMLATASIGAIWGGPPPFFGARTSADVFEMMNARFLITDDSFQYEGNVYQPLKNLPEITGYVPSIEKVILIATQEDTRRKDLSNIRNCVFLEDFLREGLSSDGRVPDLVFEQLTFDHPVCVNFTSGTTGKPKAAVHSIGSMLASMADLSFCYDLKSGDVVSFLYPVGWNLWDSLIPCLSLGMKFFVYPGSHCYTVKGCNFWDLLAKYRVKSATLLTTSLDAMEKFQIIPSQGSDMSFLNVIGITGSPVKNNNFEYLRNKINKDLFIGVIYGSTELIGCVSGMNRNMPIHGGEIQIPALGVDLQCFDKTGNSVVGKIGECVIASPSIKFLTHLWNDPDKSQLTEMYLSKFPGVWAQYDDCWINPKTKGMVVIGRSDEMLSQYGGRFSAADIYFAIHSLDELHDYICVSQKNHNGDSRAILFVKLRDGITFTPEMRTKIEEKVKEELFYECVPELILEAPEIPYNLNNKRMESLVRKIIDTNKIPEVTNIRNPNSLQYFVNIPEILDYNKI